MICPCVPFESAGARCGSDKAKGFRVHGRDDACVLEAGQYRGRAPEEVHGLVGLGKEASDLPGQNGGKP